MFDHWHRGNQRLAAMERWMQDHGATIEPDDWQDRSERLEAFRMEVDRRYSDWMVRAIEVATVYERMRRHLDRERIERLHRLDFLTPGTNPSAVRRQWRWYLRDDYESPPF